MYRNPQNQQQFAPGQWSQGPPGLSQQPQGQQGVYPSYPSYPARLPQGGPIQGNPYAPQTGVPQQPQHQQSQCYPAPYAQQSRGQQPIQPPYQPQFRTQQDQQQFQPLNPEQHAYGNPGQGNFVNWNASQAQPDNRGYSAFPPEQPQAFYDEPQPEYENVQFDDEEDRQVDSAYEDNYAEDDSIEEALRQRPDAQQILRQIRRDHQELYRPFRQGGMNDELIDYVFFFMINYTIDHSSQNQSASQIYSRFRREMPWFNLLFAQYNIPNNVVDRTLTRVIQITLDAIRHGGSGNPGQPGRPESPGRGWSRWEDLGGTITSAPAVSSWAPNRLDAFARGTDNAMYHKWWDGSRWSNWENLGGVLSSAPAAVSWGPNRIDTFVRGTDNALYHKWWDGSRWSNWENLGGVLTSGPTVSSRRQNHLDVFVRGTNNRLYKKTWNGSRWEEWEDLGGNLNSEPAAISWGSNRIDLFARASNNGLLHRHWNGSRWSTWSNLGGNIASAPTVSSRRPNQLEVFARSRNNDLLRRTWNGSRWSGWETLRGPITSAPAAISWNNNRTDVFARGQNNSLIHTYQGR